MKSHQNIVLYVHVIWIRFDCSIYPAFQCLRCISLSSLGGFFLYICIKKILLNIFVIHILDSVGQDADQSHYAFIHFFLSQRNGVVVFMKNLINLYCI